MSSRSKVDSLEPGSVTGWAAYVAGVVWALRLGGAGISGADVAIDGDVPAGSGLSSSAALECSVAAALAEAYGLGPVARRAGPGHQAVRERLRRRTQRDHGPERLPARDRRACPVPRRANARDRAGALRPRRRTAWRCSSSTARPRTPSSTASTPRAAAPARRPPPCSASPRSATSRATWTSLAAHPRRRHPAPRPAHRHRERAGPRDRRAAARRPAARHRPPPHLVAHLHARRLRDHRAAGRPRPGGRARRRGHRCAHDRRWLRRLHRRPRRGHRPDWSRRCRRCRVAAPSSPPATARPSPSSSPPPPARTPSEWSPRAGPPRLDRPAIARARCSRRAARRTRRRGAVAERRLLARLGRPGSYCLPGTRAFVKAVSPAQNPLGPACIDARSPSPGPSRLPPAHRLSSARTTTASGSPSPLPTSKGTHRPPRGGPTRRPRCSPC